MWFYKPGKYLFKDGLIFHIDLNANNIYYVSYFSVSSLESRIVLCENNQDICRKYLEEIFNKLKEKGEPYVVL